MSQTMSKTPVAPARPPSGFPVGHARYHTYLLFALTSVFMFIGAAVLLVGLRALGAGEAAWNGYLEMLGSPVMLLLSLVVLGFTLYFVGRWSWIGRKIAAGRVGPLPGPPLPMPVLGVAPIAAFLVVWVLVVWILGGA